MSILRGQNAEFDPVALEPFIIQKGLTVTLAGVTGIPLKITELAGNFNNIHSPDELRLALIDMAYVCSTSTRNDVIISASRIKEQKPIVVYFREIWGASRAIWIAKNITPARSITKDPSGTQKKIYIGDKEMEMIVAMRDSISLLKDRRENKFTANMRAIRHIRVIVEQEAILGNPSIDQLKNSAAYLSIIASTSSLSTLERIEIEETSALITSMIHGDW